MDHLPAAESYFVNGILQYTAETMCRDYGTVPKNKNYVSSTVSLYSMDDFRSVFRITRTGFQLLLEEIAPLPIYSDFMGRPQKDITQQCLLSMKYMGTQESLRSLAQLFDVTL